MQRKYRKITKYAYTEQNHAKLELYNRVYKLFFKNESFFYTGSTAVRRDNYAR